MFPFAITRGSDFGQVAWTWAVQAMILGCYSACPRPAMLKPLLALLLGTPLSAIAAEPSPLSLEETFDAYVRVLTQGDEQAKATLRNSLLSAKDLEPADVDSIIEGVSSIGNFSASFSGTSLESIADALSARQSAVSCVTTAIARSDVDGAGQATVNYRCDLPDVSGYFPVYRRIYMERKAEADDPSRASRFINDYARALMEAPTVPYDGEAIFLQAGDDGPWTSPTLPLLGVMLTKSLLPLSEWRERIEAEAAAAYSGIPACDLMLDAQLKFVERYDRDSTLLRGTALQDAVDEKVRTLGPELAAAYCRGILERFRER
ncbi:hypothetical protein [Stenotrophomonas forensis]